MLALAVAARLLVALAYRPALLWTDSWGYLDVAYRDSPVGFQPERPSGYPLILHALALPGRSLLAVTTLQHLAGLATGVLVYALLLRFGATRWAAVLAAAIVLLDARAIALEQHVLTEAFFTLTLLGAMFLAVTAGPRSRAGPWCSGALLALAITMRTGALFAVPAWLAYLALRRRSALASVLALVGLVVPLLGYSALHAQGDRTRRAGTGQFGLSEMDGWFLYSRVAPVADCAGAGVPRAVRSLCQSADQRRDDSDFYLWDARSPARQLFRGGRDKAEQIRDNRLLRRFALAVIVHDPWPYAGVVGRDLLRFFRPGGGGVDVTVSLPAAGAPLAGGGRAPLPCKSCDGEATEPLDARVRDRWFPAYHPSVHAGSGLARTYARWVRAPRLLLAALALTALAALVLTAARRAEIVLLVGTALLLLLGDAATAKFSIRYLLPIVPLLVTAGTLAALQLATTLRSSPLRSRAWGGLRRRSPGR